MDNSRGLVAVVKKWLLLICLLILLGLFFYFRLYHYLTFDNLKQHRDLLINWRMQHLPLAILGFMLIYIVAVACSIPGATLLTLAGGFIFGPWLGTLLVVISATLGASLIFLAVNLALHDWFARKTGSWLKTMEHGFQQHAFSYLLTLRLIPLFPFWLVNIVPALLGMPLRLYMLATAIGIIPGSCIYVLVGNGLGRVFDQNQTVDLGIIFAPYILLPLLGLAALSLLPIIYKTLQGRHRS